MIKSNAKINLTLDIVGRREDGYHLIKSVMHPIPLYDFISIKQKRRNISLTCNLPYIPTDERNLAFRAAQIFFENADLDCGVHININKNIPVGAGLGGGSSNAAAVLVELNKMFKTNLTKKQLSSWGLKIGADVPFFIYNQTQLAKGIGEDLSPLPPFPTCQLLVIMPPFSINTKWAYGQVKNINLPCKSEDLIKELENGDLKQASKNISNHLEDSIIKHYPQIKQYKNLMLKNGALNAQMTGSGSAVFGIFENGKNLLPIKNQFNKCNCFILKI